MYELHTDRQVDKNQSKSNSTFTSWMEPTVSTVKVLKDELVIWSCIYKKRLQGWLISGRQNHANKSIN